MTGKSSRNSRRLTLHDLAEHARVSPATVSLVLRKSPLVAKDTRARVLASIEALGYVYNRGAASLRTRRTNTIGAAMNELVNPYFMGLTAAIERAMAEIGYRVFLANSEEDPARQARFIETMREYNADGLVVCPVQGTDPAELAKQVRAAGLPCVLISRDLPGSGLDYAGHDHEGAMRLAVEHLIGLGHRRIAMIGGSQRTETGRERQRGYLAALTAHGIRPARELELEGPPTRSFGMEAIHRLLSLKRPPTAACCFNDVIAFGVMLGLRRMGLEPGRDFAVTGNDDTAEAALWTPALTTTVIDSPRMGENAANLLLQRLENPAAPPRRIVLEPKLVIRESSGGKLG
jgi:LacI family transcriptional regulator